MVDVEKEREPAPTYSDRYYDDTHEYRHVVLLPEQAALLPKDKRLLTEYEWRSLGVQQSRGWAHYAVHRPEPHILLFRRPKFYGTDKEVKPPPAAVREENTMMN